MNSEKSNERKTPATGSLAKLMQAVAGPNIESKTTRILYEDSKMKLLKIGDKLEGPDNRQRAVTEHLNELYEGQDLCDLTLHVGSAHLNIHKVVLSRCSQKYLDIFSGASEAEKPLTDITLAEGIDLESAKQVVKFMYKRKIKLTSNNIDNILALSSQLGITLLIHQCEEFMKNCPAEKIAKYIVLSARHQLDDTKRQLIGLAAKYFDAVSKSMEFVKLSADDLTMILSTPNSHGNGEAMLYQAILKWLEASPERSEMAAQLLKTVDLKKVDPRRIALIDSNVETCKVLDVKRILLDAYKEPISNFFKFELSGKVKRWDFLKSSPEPCSFHSAVFTRGKLYVLGGCVVVSPTTASDPSKLPILEPVNTVRCYDTTDARWTLAAPMCRKRMFFPAVELSGSIYVIGGIGGNNTALDSVECYSPRANKWKSLPSLPLGCAGSAACAHAGTIFVVGGYLTSFDRVLTMSTVFCYNFEAERWDAKSPMKQKMIFGSAVEAAGTLYVLGGAATNSEGNADDALPHSLSDVWRCNDDATDWTLAGSLAMPRHSAGAISIGNVIYAIGGLSYGQVTPLSTVETFNVATRRMSREPELNLPYALSGSAYALISSLK